MDGPRGVAALLDVWGEKLGGPRAGVWDPVRAHARDGVDTTTTTHRTSLVHFCHTVMWCCCWPTEHLSYTFVTLCDVMPLLTRRTSLIHFCYTVWCDAVADPLNVSRILLSHCDVMLLLTHRTSLVHFCHNVWCDAVSNPQNISRTLLSHCVMWCCCWPTEHLSYTFVTMCDVMPLVTHRTSLVYFCHTVWCDAVADPQNISRTLLSQCVMWCR